MQPQQEVVVLWLQRDLRLHDNPALTAALLTAKKVVITYVWAKEEEGQFQPGRASRWWLHKSLQTLEAQVREKGAYVCYRRGPCAADQLISVCKEVGAACVFFNNVYDPLSLVRGHDIKQRLASEGIVARSFNSDLLYEPWDVVDDDGKPFSTFEAFWRKVTSGMPVPPAEPSFVEATVLPTIVTAELRRLSLDDLGLESADEHVSNQHFSREWKPGTAAGLGCLVDFLENRLPQFDHDRAKMDRNSTSRLSPYIHFGEISVRVMHHEVMRRHTALVAQRPGSTACVDLMKQIGYREYSRYLSFHFPFTHERSLLEHLRAAPWVQCPMRFRAWRQGETGYPIVDASMRQLWATGWMHNRARVFTASFFVKHLLLPWQWGLKHFWDMLLDADLECDVLGWQYVAGCLVDSKPFAYMMDVEQESKRFDPTGEFIKQWLPELAALPLEHIHCPWDAPANVLAAAGVRLGEHYAMPIVSLDEAQAALCRANSVVMRCQAPRALQPEPYRQATLQVDMSELEPEEEVEQGAAPCAASAQDIQQPSMASGSTGDRVHVQAPPSAAAISASALFPLGSAPAGIVPAVMVTPSAPATSGRASCGTSGDYIAHARAAPIVRRGAFAPVSTSPAAPCAASGPSSRDTGTQLPCSLPTVPFACAAALSGSAGQCGGMHSGSNAGASASVCQQPAVRSLPVSMAATQQTWSPAAWAAQQPPPAAPSRLGNAARPAASGTSVGIAVPAQRAAPTHLFGSTSDEPFECAPAERLEKRQRL